MNTKASDVLADKATEATEELGGVGSVVVTVYRTEGGIGIVIGSDLNDVSEIKLLLEGAVAKL